MKLAYVDDGADEGYEVSGHGAEFLVCEGGLVG